MRTDIRRYSFQELTLLVMNTEFFYTMRHDLIKNNGELLKEYFIFNQTQFNILKQDIINEEV